MLSPSALSARINHTYNIIAFLQSPIVALRREKNQPAYFFTHSLQPASQAPARQPGTSTAVNIAVYPISTRTMYSSIIQLYLESYERKIIRDQ